MIALLETFHLLRPWWLGGLLPVVILGWWLLRRDDPTSDLKESIAPHLLRPLMISSESGKQVRPMVLAIPIWITSLVALSGPTWQKEPPPWAEDESSLYIVLRMTPSMLSDDVQPSRLEKTYSKLHDLMELREGSRTGLVVYSKSAHLVMPATDDAVVIEQMLQSLDPSMMPGEGDALADALTIASNHLQKPDVAGSILIVADGCESEGLTNLEAWRKSNATPAQWLVPLPVGSPLKSVGIETAASVVCDSATIMTPDATDLSLVNRKAKKAIVSVASADATLWRDDGIWLVWPVAAAMAFWFRRGWSLTA